MRVSNSNWNINKERILKNKNFLTLDNDDNINNRYEKKINMNDPYEILNEKINSTKTKTPKLITTVDNINHKKKYLFKKPKIKLPLLKSRQLFTEADLIVKKGIKLEGLTPLHIPTNIIINKSNEINMNNHIIRKIKEKRQEIKDNEKNYLKFIDTKNKEYEKEYKKYLNLVENQQKKQKEEDNIIQNLKKDLNEKESILMKEKEKNKILTEKIKSIINALSSYYKYGKFIHKIFGQDFLFIDIKENNYSSKIVEEIIKNYEMNNNDEENQFYEMLLSQGVDYFWIRWQNLEENVRNQIKRIDEINDEIKILNNENKNELKILQERKEDVNKDKILYNKNKKEQNNLLKGYNYENINKIKKYLNYIVDVGNKILENKTLSINNINMDNNNEMIENGLIFCEEIIKALEDKENIVNNYINKIEEIYNTGNNDDICLIEKIINERRKLNIRVKQNEINKTKEDLKKKNFFKNFENQKIIIKGRKVIQDYPLFKNRNNKKKIKIKSPDFFDYLYYSSEEEDS